MNNEIVILERPIRQKDGLYCLNDLHKASGGANRHKPAEWLRLNQTNELIGGVLKSVLIKISKQKAARTEYI